MVVSEKPPPTPPIEGGMVRVKLKKRIPKSYTSRKNQKFISNMVKFTNFCGIFATVFMVATAITIVSCSQDDDDYNSEMYTLAEQEVMEIRAMEEETPQIPHPLRPPDNTMGEISQTSKK